MKLLFQAISLLVLAILEKALTLMIRPLTALNLWVLSRMAVISLAVRGTTKVSDPVPSPSPRRGRRPREAAPASTSMGITANVTDQRPLAASSSPDPSGSVSAPVT